MIVGSFVRKTVPLPNPSTARSSSLPLGMPIELDVILKVAEQQVETGRLNR
jgi:hypothetical protein